MPITLKVFLYLLEKNTVDHNNYEYQYNLTYYSGINWKSNFHFTKW